MAKASFDKLRKLVPPPKAPAGARGKWPSVEKELGKRLPDDWKELVEHYGYGSFADFLNVFSPFFAPCTMMSQARGMLDADRELQKAVPEAVPFPLYPDAGGALPWAQSDNGHAVYWITKREKPNEWPVGVFNPRGGKLDVFDGGAADFLVSWLSSAKKVPGFPSLKEEGRAPTFDRWLERTHTTIHLAKTGDPPEDHEGTSYAWRLEKLIAALGPVERRGQYGDDEEESRQVHFVTEGGDCRFTYDTLYGHSIRLAAPPARIEAIETRIVSALPSMRCARKKK